MTTQSKKPENGSRPRVLVVDDSRVIRKAIERILAKEFDIQEADDGEAGWQNLANDDRIEVVVSDIEMPRLDGYALLCRIRAAEEARVRDVPVIVITGAQDDQTRERALACGATDFITKPLDGVQLLARARAHARLDETTRALAETTSELNKQATNDSLTGLHSRRYFLDQGEQSVAYAKRHGTDLSVILLEIDDYAGYHQRLGEAACLEMQMWLASRLKATTRTEDTIARLGEGVFGVLAPATGRMEAAVLCERLRGAVNNTPHVHNGEPLGTTISLGIASEGRDPGDTIDALIKLADQRLILAKAAGGNRMGSLYQDELPAPEEAVMETPDLDTAMRLIETGEGGKLLPYLSELALRVLPLLEHCNQQLALDATYELEALKDKISGLK